MAERKEAGVTQDVDHVKMEIQKDTLIVLIESDFGLLDKLLSSGALTKVTIADVISGTTLYKKNECLLNYIFSGNKHQDLMKALSACDQHHVVNWVRGNGEYKEEFGFNWPLRETEEKILDCNQETLIDLLNADEVLPKLYAMRVINNRQRQSIGSKPTEYERSGALLDAVRRFSLKSYFTFKECLRQSGQSHVAAILENGGFIVPVHATLECENLDDVETQIVDQMAKLADDLMTDASVEQRHRLMAALQLRVIATKRGKSIVVYISCINEEEFIHLCKINDNLEMRKILEQLFNLLIPNVKIKILFVSVLSKDIVKAKQIFKVSIPSIFVEFKATLNFSGENLSENRSSYSDIYRVLDVTKFKKKVYVLCLIPSKGPIPSWGLTEDASFSAMICVFEDRSPYTIVEEILLRKFNVSKLRNIVFSDFNKFKSIVSSIKENCLYLLTSSKKENHYVDEVIRVEIKENEENSLKHPSKWLELEKGYRPYALFISRDGYLMMVSRSPPIILKIYDPDAKLRISVKLHEVILEARKAVETSNGNFIILHSVKRQTEDADDGERAKEIKEYNVLYKRDEKDHVLGERERDFVWTVSEVSRDGKTIIRRFIPQNQQQQLNINFLCGGDLCIDSEGCVFVADTDKHRVIVLDAYLLWIGSLSLQVKSGDENNKLLWPLKLSYDEDSHKMIVAGESKVHIYKLILK